MTFQVRDLLDLLIGGVVVALAIIFNLIFWLVLIAFLAALLVGILGRLMV